MRCRHTNYIGSREHPEPEVIRITCMDCGLSVRFYPVAAPTRGGTVKWGVSEWRGQE